MLDFFRKAALLSALFALTRGEGPVPVAYQYEYAVKDTYTGQDFGLTEARNGYNTQGGYEVQLPDGRRQIVTYSVKDPASGYVADVQYQGEAVYADQPTARYQPKAAYPAPAPAAQYQPVAAPVKYPAPVTVAPVKYPAPVTVAPVKYPAPITVAPVEYPAPSTVEPVKYPAPVTVAPVKYPAPVTYPSRPARLYPITAKTTETPVPTEVPVTSTTSAAYEGPTYVPRSAVGDLYYADTMDIAESRMLHTLFKGDVKEKMVPKDSADES